MVMTNGFWSTSRAKCCAWRVVAALALGVSGAGGEPIAPELLVKWRDGPESYAAAVGNAMLGSTVAATFLELGWQQVRLADGMSLEDGLRRYRELGSVLGVEPNARVSLVPHPIDRSELASTAPGNLAQASSDASKLLTTGADVSTSPAPIPNDPRFQSQWNLKTIRATNAWAITTGSSNIVVAILDTGIDYTHPDLADNMWRNPGETGVDASGRDKATNGVDDDGNGYIDDVYGIDPGAGDSDPMDGGFFGYYHGTACAGIIGAVGNNGRGVAGINWHVQLMAIKCLRRSDEEFPPISSWLEGFNYVLMMKKRGVNVRATSNSYGHWPSQAWRDAVELASEAGILTVCALGNEGRNADTQITGYPAQFNSLGVVSVAASTASDGLAAFSNFGRTAADLAAPGVGIVSTFVGLGGYITTFDGTSAAAPHVAGAVALLCAARPEATVAEIKAALLQSVDQPAGFRGKVMSNGRLNLERALQLLVETNLPPVVIHVAPDAVLDLERAPLSVIFSKPMNRASVEAAFTLTNSIQGAVSGSFEWSDNNHMLTFTPGQKLAGPAQGFVRITSQAQDAGGLFLDGNFDRVAAGESKDDFVWSFRTPPANDDPSGAITLAGESGEISGTNAGADDLGDVEATTPKADVLGIASGMVPMGGPAHGRLYL